MSLFGLRPRALGAGDHGSDDCPTRQRLFVTATPAVTQPWLRRSPSRSRRRASSPGQTGTGTSGARHSGGGSLLGSDAKYPSVLAVVPQVEASAMIIRRQNQANLPCDSKAMWRCWMSPNRTAGKHFITSFRNRRLQPPFLGSDRVRFFSSSFLTGPFQLVRAAARWLPVVVRLGTPPSYRRVDVRRTSIGRLARSLGSPEFHIFDSHFFAQGKKLGHISKGT